MKNALVYAQNGDFAAIAAMQRDKKVLQNLPHLVAGGYAVVKLL